MTAQELEKLLAEVTPGEWIVGLYGELTAVVRDGRLVASSGGYSDGREGTRAENIANASLIAMAPTLARRVIAAEKLAEALQTSKDYVDDASRGKLRYLGMSDISEMAGDDLVFIQAALDEWDAAK